MNDIVLCTKCGCDGQCDIAKVENIDCSLNGQDTCHCCSEKYRLEDLREKLGIDPKGL